MSGPLDGVRVLEVGSWLAVPGAGALMADMGADVVKVEPPAGDAYRGLSDASAPSVDWAPSFEYINRGKRSITIDLERPGGPELLRRLSTGADVLMTNLTRHRAERFGLTYEAVREASARIVYLTHSGYGTRGPDADRSGFDTIAFWARSGIMSLIGTPSTPEPVMPRPGQGDRTTSLNILAAVLAGLRLRDREGTSQRVEVTLQQTGVWTIATDVQNVLATGEAPRRSTRFAAASPLVTTYQTGDGRWLMLTMPQAGHYWAAFCDAIEAPEWATDPRFSSHELLLEHANEARELIDERFLQHDLAYWSERLIAHGIVWGPMTEILEVVQDPQLREMGMFETIEHPRAGQVEIIAAPFHIDDADIRARGPAPEAGQHTREVLAEFGLDETEMAELAAAGVLG